MSLELRGISKTVDGEPWLSDIDLVLERGLNILVGPTLAGKTTLMRIAAGLDQPTAGRILVDGVDITGRPVRERDVAFVYQEFVNYPSLTVFDNIASPLERRGRRSKSEVADRVHEVAQLLQLEPYLRRRPAELSGGQQQRVAIARALARQSDLLVLDEPLANLDYKLREELREELNRIFASQDAVVLYSTSEPTEALILGGRTAVMHEGRVLQVGEAVDGFRRPRTAQVARVFSDPPMNLLQGEVKGPSLRVGGGIEGPRPDHFADLAEGPVLVGIRPHRLAVEPTSDADIVLGGHLRLAELTGSATYLHVDVGVDVDVDADVGDESLIAEVPGVHSHPLGEHLELFVAPSSLYAFDVASGELVAHPDWTVVAGG